ncbi:hypothetical protein DE146DRAFT_669447 [Phaeosphaeria sp. MPI-PUGE-AT-0046c]|nr:hypothetical protein DE146DRAFT_669447 [Phaeosphaeria sp. MPI-PUGE-AT-0046c]
MIIAPLLLVLGTTSSAHASITADLLPRHAKAAPAIIPVPKPPAAPLPPVPVPRPDIVNRPISPPKPNHRPDTPEVPGTPDDPTNLYGPIEPGFSIHETEGGFTAAPRVEGAYWTTSSTATNPRATSSPTSGDVSDVANQVPSRTLDKVRAPIATAFSPSTRSRVRSGIYVSGDALNGRQQFDVEQLVVALMFVECG